MSCVSRSRSLSLRTPLFLHLVAFFLPLLLLSPNPVQAVPADGPRPQPSLQEAKRKTRAAARLLWGADKQTANQALYDVLYYDLDLTIDPGPETVSGTVTVRATPTGSPINEIELNLLDNMTVNGVEMSGSAVPFTHASDILTVTLDAAYAAGDTFAAVVDYQGSPNPSWGAFGFDSYLGDPMIWSLSEPYGARSWWPCKDLPEDKADSVDIRITVPSNLIVASNGVLRDTSTVSGWTTYQWHEGYPIVTYLVSIAIHPYAVFSDWYHYSPTDSMEIRNYVFPSHLGTAQSSLAVTEEMILAFAGLFGEYPFLDEKYGHAEFLWGGAMEHQTMTSLGYFSEYLIAHELGHQWWGDMITCNSFHHIWLNEGFATYCEALWTEYKYGWGLYKRDMKNIRYFGPGTIYVEDPTDFNSIFDPNLSYNKGAWVLHMLRHVVSDSTFFDILQTYYADPAAQHGTATTEEFQAICESISGLDLSDFFQQWIYDEYYPIYSYTWATAPGGGGYEVTLQIDQKQTNRVFTMPIDVRVFFGSGDTTLVIQDTLASETFVLQVNDSPVDLKLDPAGWILKGVQEGIENPTFHRGILLVNGVDWSTYGTEITSAYEDSVFWGDHAISFWDCFAEPGTGYPSNLPPALGHGSVPSDTLRQYSTVIWVGNNYNGDIVKWVNTSVLDYVEAGGNLLLMTRMGQDFLYSGMADYLGITWNGTGYYTLGNCTATYPGLVDVSFTGTQSYAHVFDTTFATGETELLFKDTSAGAQVRGTGVWRNPAGGGTHRPDGGKLVFLSGRPYRMNHDQLRADVNFILSNLLGEPYDATGTSAGSVPGLSFSLGRNRPNPFNPVTTIEFTIPMKTHVALMVFAPSGRLVRTLVDQNLQAGRHTVAWDGKDRRGRPSASGVYFCKMEATDFAETRKMVLIR